MPAQKRTIQQVLLFNGRAVYSNGLWVPETKDLMGKPLDKPSYSIGLIFPKSRANWWEEGYFASLANACKTVWQADMAHVTSWRQVEWPVKDGDIPNTKGNVPDWGVGHWVITPRTNIEAPKVEMMANGQQVELPGVAMGGRRPFGDGDYVATGVSVAKRSNDMVGIKAYLNSICFTGKGDEIKVGGMNVDWASAIAQAQAQGITVKTGGPGFTPFNPGAAGGAPSFAPFTPGQSTGRPAGVDQDIPF